jgi:hypothetical protein
MEREGSLPYSQELAEALWDISWQVVFSYGEELLAPRPTPWVEIHPLWAVLVANKLISVANIVDM